MSVVELLFTGQGHRYVMITSLILSITYGF